MKKQSFTMRLFSILLCVAMLCTFAPLTSLAKVSEQVYVGGIEVTADNANDVLGDGTVSYDKYTKTLTLNGAGIYDTYDTDEGSYGIFTTGDLSVVVENSPVIDILAATDKDHVAGIEAGGDLYVTGCGSFQCSIPPAADFAAALVAGGALSVDVEVTEYNPMLPIFPESVSLDVAKAPKSYALFADSIDVTLGKIRMEFEATTSVFNVKPTLENLSITDTYAASDDVEYYDSEVLAHYAALDYFYSELADIPYVWVNGEQLTVKNMDDVLGDGTVYWDVLNYELVFDNATITDVYRGVDDFIESAGLFTSDELAVRLIGENVIDLRNVEGASAIAGICGSGLILLGDGDLTVYAGDAQDASAGMYLGYLNAFFSGDLAVYSGEAKETAGIYAQGAWFGGVGDATFVGAAATDEEFGMSCGGVVDDIFADGTKFDEESAHGVRFIGETNALCGTSEGSMPSVDYNSDVYVELCGKLTDGTDLAERDDEGDNALAAAKYYFLKSTKERAFDLWIAGEQLTVKNMDDVLGDGSVSVSFEYDCYIVTLNNATIDKAHFDEILYSGIYCGDDCTVFIELVGDNVIDLTECSMPDAEAIFGIFHCGNDYNDVILSGDGSLTINVPAQAGAESYGIYVNDDFYIEDEATTLTVTLPDAEDTYGIYSYSEVEIYSPNVSIVAGTTALTAHEEIYVSSENAVIFLCSTAYNGEVEEKAGFIADAEFRNTCKTVKTAVGQNPGAGYNLWVGGVRVNPANESDVLGDGTVSFDGYESSDAGYYVLTLNNANINSGTVFYDGAYIDAGIYCYLYDDLCLRLIGDNVINVTGDQAEYAMGLFTYYSLYVEGDGTLTINVVGSENNDAAYGINADWDYETLYLRSGAVTVNVSGDSPETLGVRASSVYDTNKGDVAVTATGPEEVYGLHAPYINLYSVAECAVTATYTTETGYHEAYALYNCNGLYDSPVSGTVTFAGQTQAVMGNLYYSGINTLQMSAYTDLAGTEEHKVESPSWSNRADYKTIVLSPGTKTVTPVLTKTAAECKWWDDGAEKEVGNNEQVTIGWDVGDEEINTVFVYADVYQNGSYNTLATLNVGSDPSITSYSRYAFSNGTDLTGKTCSWVIGVLFKDGTLATSAPFDVTFYRVCENGTLYGCADMPEVGLMPGDIDPAFYSNYGYYADQETSTWYVVEDGEKIEMEEDDIFLPGKQYALHTESVFGDTFVLDGESLTVELNGAGLIKEESTVSYDDTTKTLSVDVIFEPLKTQLEIIYVDYEGELDSSMTPADFACKVTAESVMRAYFPTIADGEITTAWTYCEGDSYDETTAVEMENDAFFEDGNTYQGKVSFKLNDRFTVSEYVQYCLGVRDPFAMPETLYGTYDDETGVVTITLPTMFVWPVVKELNMFVCEPEAGQTPMDISAFGDKLVDDYISNITITWYELNEEGESEDGPMASNEEFKAGVTYGMTMNITLTGADFINPSIPVTLNGQEPEYSEIVYRDSAYLCQRFTVAEATTTVDALDFTVSELKIGEKPEDVTVTYDTDQVAFVNTYGFEYKGTGDPATDLEGYHEMKPEDVFEFGKTYAIEVEYVLKSGLENSEEIALTINGEEPFVAYLDGRKKGNVVASFSFDEPVLTLSANATEFTLGDAALEVVSFALDYSFEATDRVLVDVTDADGDDMLCAALAADTEGFAFDMSDFEVGTYTVTATAFVGGTAVVSNSVEIVVKAKPTTTESTTATATETEPTATATEPSATGTATEPTATVTEPTTTGTQADEILYGDANGDCEINMKDVLTLRKHLAGIEIMLHPLNSDANGDGEINMKDVLMIRKYMAGLIDELGPTA